MIVVTGAAGFIGSNIALSLCAQRPADSFLLIDHAELFKKYPYTHGISNKTYMDAEEFLKKLALKEFSNSISSDISIVIHMGAITNTGEKDTEALAKWNSEYTKSVWKFCCENKIDFIYASSAATYGDGRQGFSDDHSGIKNLRPLNPYGQSKQDFDLWALEQSKSPPNWYGLKFFNVYGPNESHKARMASSIWHGYNEIKKNAVMTLFKSHNPDFKDGEQARDFIYIDDILNIVDFLIGDNPQSGIYNCGTGRASTFSELSESLFHNMNLTPKINFIPTPLEFRAGYQYKTEAVMTKLKSAGYHNEFTKLGDGVKKYLSSIEKIKV
jgi:ADP-L-glycero-D-manno-heptose 6-epimerase